MYPEVAFHLEGFARKSSPWASTHSTFLPPPAVLSLQAGFAAEGVESGTVFSDISLQEKVRRDPARLTLCGTWWEFSFWQTGLSS